MSPPPRRQSTTIKMGPGKSRSGSDQQVMRHDSPFQVLSPVPSTTEMGKDCVENEDILKSTQVLTSQAVDQQSTLDNTGSGLRFFVVDHPDQLRDREQMRQNRKHVMQDYLEKERLKPGSTGNQVSRCNQDRRRKRSDPLPHSTSATSSVSRQTKLAGSGSLPQRDDDSGISRNGSLDSRPPTKRPASPGGGRLLEYSPIVRRRRIMSAPETVTPLVTGIGGQGIPPHYLSTNIKQVPFPLRRFGGDLNPFNTWPAFLDTTINVSALKLKCSQRFGSRSLAESWVPTLLSARPAFLSTICISSAHDDIIGRSSRPVHTRSSFESLERLRVREQVIDMINQSMEDPSLQTADVTIIAVLQLLNAEIIGCNEASIKVHQKGLYDMIHQRGGLHALGVNGFLASIFTITMHIIAILHENSPHQICQAYANKQSTKSPRHTRALPESPVYCKPTGYVSIKKAIPPNSITYQLLDDLRKLTSSFFLQQSSCPVDTPGSTNDVPALQDYNDNVTKIISNLRTKMNVWRGAELYDFEDHDKRQRFEAIRLTSLIYALSLDEKMSFSSAAAKLKDQVRSPDSTSHSSQWEVTSEISRTTLSIPVQIKNALVQSDTSDCWGPMIGVLFWITLVAGAAANRRISCNKGEHPEHEDDEEEARKWLAATTVRCSILLSFEFGGVVLETLRRVVAIQQALRCTTDSVGSDNGYGSDEMRIYGPQEAQRGFGDFAIGFLDD